MSKRYMVANNICRANTAGGITLDPSTRDGEESHRRDPRFVCDRCLQRLRGQHGRGIQTIHAATSPCTATSATAADTSGNDSESAGIAISYRGTRWLADNVLIANRYGVAFWVTTSTAPPTTSEMGHHLLGGNVYDGEQRGDLHRRTPSTDPAAARATARR